MYKKCAQAHSLYSEEVHIQRTYQIVNNQKLNNTV